jgi:hypothetical protein
MKRTLSLIAAAAVLALSATSASAETKTTTTTKTSAQANAPQEQGFFDKVGNFFAGEGKAEAPQTEAEMEAQARAHAKAAPAAGNAKFTKQQSPSNTAKRKPADQTNPVVGRVISEEGANLGVHSNVRMGAGVGGSVGNE